MSYYGSIYREELLHRAKALYICLCDRAGKDGESWYAIDTMAKDLKFSRSTVKRALQDLLDADLIEKQARFRPNGACTSNMYRVKKR